MRIEALLALLLCVSLLAGCTLTGGTETSLSGSKTATTASTETSAVPTETSAAATEPSEATQATDPVEVWSPPMGYETNEQGKGYCIIDCAAGTHSAVSADMDWQMGDGCGFRAIWVYAPDGVIWVVEADGMATPVLAVR